MSQIQINTNDQMKTYEDLTTKLRECYKSLHEPLCKGVIKFQYEHLEKLKDLSHELNKLFINDNSLIELAYIAGRNDEKQNSRPPYIRIKNGWDGFKEEHNLLP